MIERTNMKATLYWGTSPLGKIEFSRDGSCSILKVYNNNEASQNLVLQRFNYINTSKQLYEWLQSRRVNLARENRLEGYPSWVSDWFDELRVSHAINIDDFWFLVYEDEDFNTVFSNHPRYNEWRRVNG